MHDVYTRGAPLLVILVGLIYNGQQVRELRSEMQGMREELRGDIQRLTMHMDVRPGRTAS